MKSLKSINEYQQLMKQDKPVLLDFYADWCHPCKTLMPRLEKLAKEYHGYVEIQKVNIDHNSALADKLKIRSIPTLHFYKKGKLIEQLNGVIPEAQLRKKINSMA